MTQLPEFGDRYEVLELLGRGGFGEVYRVRDRALETEVALKTVYRPRGIDLQLLKAEFRSRSALHHRNLVQLYELEVGKAHCFLTMELIRGDNLARWVRGGISDSSAVGEQAVSGQAPTAKLSQNESSPTTIDLSAEAVRSSGAWVSAQHNPPNPELRPPLDSMARERLIHAVTELLTALRVLHEAGLVHRDIKPDNVLVEASGRLVLMDFGLAVGGQLPSAARFAGTPRYMAPEQFRGEDASPASDMYAVGCVLYELLAGRPPFLAGALQAKIAGEPAPAIASDRADATLLALIDDLLATASRRPTARQALQRISPSARTEEDAGPVFGIPVQGAFFGRAKDLATLHEAFDHLLAERRPIIVQVEGPSGIGKSTLVRQFLSTLPSGKTGEHRPIVLAGRCHPQETVPFKALDAAIDSLAVQLQEFPREQRSAVRPERPWAATQLFPALASIPEFAYEPAPALLPEPLELRALGFTAMRQLMRQISRLAPVVLWIDDLQWGDADSLRLLEDVLQSPGAPPILLLLSYRSEPFERTALLAHVASKEGPFSGTHLRLEPLASAEIEPLIRFFLRDGDARVKTVVQQCEGNPFLASELARYLATVDDPAGDSGGMELPQLILARLQSLPAEWRAMVETLSVAVRPVSIDALVEAAGVSGASRSAVMALRDAYLLRRVWSSRGSMIAVYHDKIAEAVRQALSAESAVERHRSLAKTLERHAPEDSDALLEHWERAGNRRRAAFHAHRAAVRAAAKLAFERAAELYEKALELGPEGVERAALLERAATMHANRGHAGQAAARYLDAARELGGDLNDARVRALNRLAGEQYVKSGRVREGWVLMRQVLKALGVQHPRSTWSAILGSLTRRIRFLRQHIDPELIRGRSIPDAERPRLEALWTASTSMSMINVPLSDAFRTMHLRRVLRVGDSSSVCRALSFEVAYEATVGGQILERKAAQLVAVVRRMVEWTRDPYDNAWMNLGEACAAFSAGHWREASSLCEEADRILETDCVGTAWERNTVTTHHLSALAMGGELRALRERVEGFLRRARAGADLYSIAEACSGELTLVWLAAGQESDKLALARGAIAQQVVDGARWPENVYRRSNMTEFVGTVHVALAHGRGEEAWRAVQRHWPGLKSAFLLSLQFYGSWLRFARGRAALAAASQPRAIPGWPRDRLLRDARAQARAIRKDPKPFARPWADLLDAGLACAAGDDGGADCLLCAIEGFERAEMALYRECARFALGQLTGESRLRSQAEMWMAGQDIHAAERMAFTLVPGVSVEA